jgi:hypothetical protein
MRRLAVVLGVALLALTGARWWLQGSTRAERRPRSTAPTLQGPTTAWSFAWGSGPDQLGRLDGDEGASEGPMSFAVTARGDLWVLDQVNRRASRFAADGRALARIPIGSDTIQDLEVTADGTLVLLDRLVRSSVTLLDGQGRRLAEHAILGDHVPEGGVVTAMFLRPEGLWLEVNHTYVVRILDGRLRPLAVREVAPGRVHAPGVTSLVAALDGLGGARLWLERLADGQVLGGADLLLDHAVRRLIWTDQDAAGNVYVFAHLLDLDDRDPRRVTHEENVAVVYGADWSERATFRTPHVISEWEQFREVRVQPDGTIHQMAFSTTGVRFLRWRWMP